MSIIDPRLFADNEVIQWADIMSGALNFFGDYVNGADDNFPRLDDASKWQEWAEGVYCCTSSLGQDVPDPYAYDNWKEWAERMFSTSNFTG